MMSLSSPSSVYNPIGFTPEEYELLNQFALSAWGQPKHFLKKDPFPEAGAIEFIDLGECSLVLEYMFAGVKLPSKFLVRDEYHIALDALKGTEYECGAFVIGQPGIGKTLFLFYLLVRFLSENQPVALDLSCIPRSCALFSKNGVEFRPTEGPGSMLHKSSFVWVLSDSNGQTISPHPKFVGHPNHIRVIQATPPEAARWKEWSKQAGAERFVMDIWSEEEIKKLAVLLQLDVKRMVELARKWGGAPRTLLKYYARPDQAVKDYRNRAPTAIRQCRMMLERGTMGDLPDKAPSLIYFIRPDKARYEMPRVFVPTRTICCYLAEALQSEDEAITLQFFKTLSKHSETRPAAGVIYESWFHSFFSAESKVIKCEWIATGAQAFTTQELTSTTNVISATEDAPASWEPPFYWIPDIENFAGVDSALVLKDEIIAFQVTIAKEHTRKTVEKGLGELCGSLPLHLTDRPWKLVLVGTNEDHLRGLAHKYAGQVFPTKAACVPVGFSVVNPVKEQVIFKLLSRKESMEPMDVD